MSVEDEAGYDCPSCGEEIRIPVDLAAGRVQEYVEDCPVCCSPVVLTIRVDGERGVEVRARPE